MKTFKIENTQIIGCFIFEITTNGSRRSGRQNTLVVRHAAGPIVARKYLGSDPIKSATRYAETVEYWRGRVSNVVDSCDPTLL